MTITAERDRGRAQGCRASSSGLCWRRLISVIGSLTGPNLGLDAEFIGPLAPVLTPVEGRPARRQAAPDRVPAPAAALVPVRGACPTRASRWCGPSRSARHPTSPACWSRTPIPARPAMAAMAISEFPGRPELGSFPRSAARRRTSPPSIRQAEHPLGADHRANPRGGARRAARRHAGRGVVPAPGHTRAQPDGRGFHRTHRWKPCSNSPTMPIDGYEIASAGLGCEVVVLTACDAGQLALGGRGRTEQPGDELFGLSAAFLDPVAATSWRRPGPLPTR